MASSASTRPPAALDALNRSLALAGGKIKGHAGSRQVKTVELYDADGWTVYFSKTLSGTIKALGTEKVRIVSSSLRGFADRTGPPAPALPWLRDLLLWLCRLAREPQDMKRLAALTLIALTAVPAQAQAPEDVAEAFGYAIQAMGWCDGIIMKVGTEDRLEAELGQSLRGDDSPLKAAYGAGLDRFFEDQAELGDEEACALAFDRVGPSGTEYAGLLMDSPFK